MARPLFLIIGIAVLGVHCEDLFQRIVRSSECDYCQRYSASVEHPPPPAPPGFPPPPYPPLPPPPPSSYHARQWTGLTRRPDGTPQGVYSGATASFNGPARNTGQVYSVASAVDDCEDNKNGQTEHYHETPKHIINENINFNRGENKVGASYGQTDRINGESHTSEEHQKNYPTNILRGDISDHEQSQIHGGTFDNINSNDKNQYGRNSQTSYSNYDARHNGNEKTTNYGRADANKINSDHQATVNGALNLAAQGIEAAEKTKECSSCGRNNYAASNASSYSGDAVAIAIGG